MLKRQRAPSPTPYSSQGTPSLLELSDIELQSRATKRRRTTPPPLDGHARGLAPTRSTESIHEDDEWDAMDRNDIPLPSADFKEYATVYTSTNKLLHDLHFRVLQRHHQTYSFPENDLLSHLDMDSRPSQTFLGVAEVENRQHPDLPMTTTTYGLADAMIEGSSKMYADANRWV